MDKRSLAHAAHRTMYNGAFGLRLCVSKLPDRIKLMWATGAYGYLSDYVCWYVVLVSAVVHTWCFFRLFPRTRPRLRLAMGNALVFVCMLILVGLAGETYIRFFVVETDAFGASLTSKRWNMAYARVNSRYCRDKEWAKDKPVGIYRVAFVGDSFTFGWGINDPRDRFTDIIQRRFDERGEDAVEVMNVAWSAWGTLDERRAIGDMIDHYDVDEVVLCYLPNDLEPLLPVTDDFDPTEPPTRFVNVQSSFLLDYVFHRVYVPRVCPLKGYCDRLWDGYADPQTWKKQQELLFDIIRLCGQRGVIFRAALLPLIRTGGDRYDAEHVHAQLAQFFAAHDVPVVDLLGTLTGGDPRELVVNHHDPHPSELAHRLFADAIWQAFYSGPEALPPP